MNHQSASIRAITELDLFYSSWQIQYKDAITSIGIPIIKVGWSYNLLIFIMGICILVRQHLYIEPGPWSSQNTLQFLKLPSNLKYKSHLGRQCTCWSLRCGWSIACQRCSNYIFILDKTPGFNGLGKDNCNMRRDTFMFWDLVHLILEVWQ